MEDQIILKCKILRRIMADELEINNECRAYESDQSEGLVKQIKGREIWIRSQNNLSIFVYANSISIYNNDNSGKSSDSLGTIYFGIQPIVIPTLTTMSILNILDTCIERLRTRFYIL